MEEDRYTRMTLRLPKELHARLDATADATSKSLNAEIVGRLEASFGKNGDPLSTELINELQRTQQLLTLNRLEAAYRIARDEELAAQHAMAKASVSRMPAAERAQVELRYSSARTDVVEAREMLEGFQHAVPLVNAARALLDARRSADDKVVFSEPDLVHHTPPNRGSAAERKARKPKP